MLFSIYLKKESRISRIGHCQIGKKKKKIRKRKLLKV